MKRIRPMQIALVALALAAVFFGWRAWREHHSREETACNSDRPDALKVLFIGNSQTFVNDLPNMFCGLARTTRAVKVKSVVAPGWSLRQHWDDGRAARAIRDESWDVVVLQENSAVAMNLGDFEGDVRLFDQLIRSVHASTAIYEVWPRRDLRQDPQVVGVRYHAIASQLQAELVPVGPAWMQALAAHPNLRLYQDDDHHARPEGTYLAACVFYAALLRQSPEGLPVSVPLDANTARDLQRVAWDVTR